jgi:hypothetical protein
MMLRALIALAALALPSAALSQTEEIPGSSFGFGGWEGSAYYDSGSGTFSHCVIAAEYASGDTLLFSVTQAATVTVGISSPAIQLPPGQAIPVAIYVDRRRPFFGTATVQSPGFATLSIPEFDRSLESFKRGFGMVVEGGGLRGEYDLSGTFRALEQTRQCAISYYNYSRMTTPEVTAAGMIDPIVTYQMATNMIAGLSIPDARYLSASELEEIELAGAVYWSSDATGVSGGVMVFDLPVDADLRDTDIISTDYLSRDCSGDLASSARAISGEINMRQVRVICVGGSKEYEAFITNAAIDGVRVVTLLRFDGGATLESDTPRMELNEELALQNASFADEAR